MIEPKVVRIHRVENGSLKAFVDLSVNDSLLIKGLRVVEGKHGPFVTMPQQQAADRKWYDVVRCLKNEVKEQISDIVLYAYQNE
ncbi:septation protein SpoVG family protein [Candidatus Gottesmanbacteria bacterium]|nr:septation protein SpoVG family protein [Candidatus Gottesmanbacteria bacterium]